MTNHKKLITLTRLFLQKYHRYDSNRTEGRYKEMVAACKILEAELELHEKEGLPEEVRGLF